MAYDQLKNSTLTRSLADVVADFSDLFQKEMRLAKAELSTKLQASVWMLAAGLLGLIAAFLVVQALVFGIASFGIAMHWSCLIVAALLGAAAALAYARGRADAKEDLMPTRTIQQIRRDIATTKERLT